MAGSKDSYPKKVSLMKNYSHMNTGRARLPREHACLRVFKNGKWNIGGSLIESSVGSHPAIFHQEKHSNLY
ncbi:hypothetical protein [Peribacillus glennii]|uniref:Uncharacterized protein n=1 Tax=Peribacillus glennii TaxID=2303991 RepID=A0A372LE80_9BACI|nr:hypothetical protein [Peribacillus glennii]RFU64108.1 hypothetical protein D0466_09240 [Peribacillus glennii]